MMAVLRDVCWWVCFLVTGIVVQLAVPGLDALIVGIMVAARRGDFKTLVWLVPVVVILQEGMGSLFFGGSALTVGCFFLLYRVGRAMAFASDFALYLFVCAGMGAVHSFCAWFFPRLQDIPVVNEVVVADGVRQTVFLLLTWALLVRLRPAGESQPPRPENRGLNENQGD